MDNCRTSRNDACGLADIWIVSLVYAIALLSGGTCSGEENVTPAPQHREPQAGVFRCVGPLIIHFSRTADRRIERVVQELATKLAKAARTKPSLRHDIPEDQLLVIDHQEGQPSVSCRAPGKPEGYHLSVEPQRVVVRGQDAAGLCYGVLTLGQLIPAGGEQIDCVRIDDWPAMPFRAYGAFALCKEEHNSRLDPYLSLVQLAAANKLNQLAFSRNKLLTDDELRHCADFCRLHFVEPVLCYAFLTKGRQDMVRYVKADDRQFGELLASEDRILRLLKPKIVCIGGDELISDYNHLARRSVYTDAQRAERAPHEWLAAAMKRFHAYFTQRGIRMAIWADSLIDEDAFLGHPAMIQGYGGKPDYHCRMADLLPKDILMWDWHYESTPFHPTLLYLQQKGFQVVGCPWQDVGNVELFAEYGARTGTDRFRGMLVAQWLAQPTCQGHEPHVVRAGDAFWSPGKYRKPDPVVDQIRRLGAENPLRNIGPGEHRIVISPDAITRRGIPFLVQSAGVRSGVFDADGLGAKPRRTVDGDYLIQAAEGAVFQSCRLTAKVAPSFTGSLWISYSADRQDFVRLAAFEGKGHLSVDLTKDISEKPLFRLRFRGLNNSKERAVFLHQFELECCVAGSAANVK